MWGSCTVDLMAYVKMRLNKRDLKHSFRVFYKRKLRTHINICVRYTALRYFGPKAIGPRQKRYRNRLGLGLG